MCKHCLHHCIAHALRNATCSLALNGNKNVWTLHVFSMYIATQFFRTFLYFCMNSTGDRGVTYNAKKNCPFCFDDSLPHFFYNAFTPNARHCAQRVHAAQNYWLHVRTGTTFQHIFHNKSNLKDVDSTSPPPVPPVQVHIERAHAWSRVASGKDSCVPPCRKRYNRFLQVAQVIGTFLLTAENLSSQGSLKKVPSHLYMNPIRVLSFTDHEIGQA